MYPFLARDITEQKRLKQAMLAAGTAVREEERKSLARDIHDEISQPLTALCLEIDAMIKSEEQLWVSRIKALHIWAHCWLPE